MRDLFDKRERSEVFRDRLAQAMRRADVNRSALARRTGADRSTVAQLLADDAARLPNAHLAACCAQVLGVSADWLLGLTDRPERPGDVIAAAVSVTQAARASWDDELLDWHREAAGYKIRHVPATLPDMLKTEGTLRWEYERALGKTAEQAIGAMQDRLALMRQNQSDFEVAVSLGELHAFASGQGYYRGLAADVRRDQLLVMATAARDFFPSLRLFFFDSRRVFSAPISVFGPLVGVVYIGRFYLAFRSRDRVRMLTDQFDSLVREAEVDARDAADWLDDLASTVSG
ncbi:MAG: helix-turn-helix transcriptional regulator [Minwuia sp.]|nr:helix-turn-helix transcriptional regulator [Minwuia sp.]